MTDLFDDGFVDGADLRDRTLEKATRVRDEQTRALRSSRQQTKKDGTNGKLSVPGGQ
jgi:hypothetical protein